MFHTFSTITVLRLPANFFDIHAMLVFRNSWEQWSSAVIEGHIWFQGCSLPCFDMVNKSWFLLILKEYWILSCQFSETLGSNGLRWSSKVTYGSISQRPRHSGARSHGLICTITRSSWMYYYSTICIFPTILQSYPPVSYTGHNMTLKALAIIAHVRS